MAMYINGAVDDTSVSSSSFLKNIDIKDDHRSKRLKIRKKLYME